MDKNRVAVVLLGILTVLAVGAVLKSAQTVIVPLVIAWLLSYILGPAVEFMSRRKIPTPLAVFLVLLLLLGICWLGGIFMNARVSAFASEYPKYRDRFSEIATALTDQFDLGLSRDVTAVERTARETGYADSGCKLPAFGVDGNHAWPSSHERHDGP